MELFLLPANTLLVSAVASRTLLGVTRGNLLPRVLATVTSLKSPTSPTPVPIHSHP